MVQIITVISLVFSILVVSSSTVFSVLWLVGTFMIISLMLALFNLSFPALIYVIVYIGAIAILFLFVIQLLGTGADVLSLTSSRGTTNKLSRSYTTLAFIFSIGMISVGVVLANTFSAYSNSVRSLGNLFIYDSDFSTFLSINSSMNVESGISTQVESFAEWIYGPGLLPLIVISVVLLVAMIAPIYLCQDTKTVST